jgi:adenosine deaminase
LRDTKRLPKAHLHLHLEGSARSSTIRELAEREGVALPTLSKRRFEDFADFSEALSAATGVLKSPEDLTRICRELVEDEAGEGVVYTEPMVVPHLHSVRFGLSPEEVFSAMWEGFEAASSATGVRVGAMIGIDRSWETERAEEASRFAAKHAGERVVSLGLAGPGRSGHEEHARFAHACEIARSAGSRTQPKKGSARSAENGVNKPNPLTGQDAPEMALLL